MSGIKDYSTTAASNQALFPENQAPSTLNDGGRQVQADVRSWYETAEWTDLGHTPTRTGNTTFTVSGDKTADYLTGRRIKCTDSATIYATIVSSSYSAPNTTVTIHSDSGNLSASLTAVALSTQKPTNISIHPNYGRKGSDIASATTTDLSTATGDFVDVTGTTTITGLGTLASGITRVVRFTGALTLTHNATSLILPGAANITTANGDVATFRSLGSGNWQCVNYMKASGASISSFIGTRGADIASATTTDLSAATGDFVDITGTTTITGLGTVAAGREMVLRFTGALTFTHNATSLILPGAANITTANGDVAIMRSLGSGNWKCTVYTKASGVAVVAAASGVTSVATSGLATGGTITSTGTITVTAAVQADQETSTSNAVAVTPGVQQYHPSAAKGWIKFTAGASTTVSYNVTSLTDNGTGDFTVNWNVDFSTANFVPVGILDTNTGSTAAGRFMKMSTCAAGTSRVLMSGIGEALTENSIDGAYVVAFGDQ
jgi:hypothetical protein